MKKIIILVLILVTLMFLLNINKYTGKVIPRHLLNGIPEWERYILDEEANKDRLYCRVTEDEYGNIIETRWYNSFINPNEVVRTDDGDTTTPDCKWPKHTPVYAKGSNEGKVYSRVIIDEKGNVLETVWHDACSDEIIRTDEGDTTYPGSNEFTGECYHPDYAVEEECFEEEEEEKDIPIVNLWSNIVSWFRNLLNM